MVQLVGLPQKPPVGSVHVEVLLVGDKTTLVAAPEEMNVMTIAQRVRHSRRSHRWCIWRRPATTAAEEAAVAASLRGQAGPATSRAVAVLGPGRRPDH